MAVTSKAKRKPEVEQVEAPSDGGTVTVQLEALVRMTRDCEKFAAPHVADVHPAELENDKRGGWVVA